MIVGLYAALGAFLILAARNPLAHRSLIPFTIWSSLLQAGIMLVQALIDRTERSHLRRRAGFDARRRRAAGPAAASAGPLERSAGHLYKGDVAV
jgi:hypothetical protein